MISFSPAGTSLAATTAVPVSDSGTANSLAYTDTARKIAVSPDGDIYVAYHGVNGLRVSRSTNRGLSFLPSVLVTPMDRDAEIAVTNNGYIYLVYPGMEGYYLLSRSFDEGAHFYPIAVVGAVRNGTVHLATDGAYLYVLDRAGTQLYRNSQYGVGAFENIDITTNGTTFSEVQVDPATHQVFVEGGTTNLRLASSKDWGQTFGPVLNLGSAGFANPTTAISPGASGNFLFLAGSQADGLHGDQAFQVNLNNLELKPLTFGWNANSRGRSLAADQYGNIVDGYHNSSSAVAFRVSRDLGQNFDAPVLVSSDARALNVAINDAFGDIIAVYENQGRIQANIYPAMLAVPDLAVSLTTDNPTPNYAEAISFNVKVSNTGREDARAIQVKVEMPAGLKQVSQQATLGSYQLASGLWNIASLATGKSANLTILAWTTQSNFKPTVSVKLVTSTPVDQSPNNNSPVLNFNIPASADIGLDLGLQPARLSPGDTVQIILHAVNHGPDQAAGVKISVGWPDGLDYLTHSTGSGTYTPANHQWNTAPLPVDQPASLVLTGKVNKPGAFELSARLTTQDQYDSNSANNSVVTRLNSVAGADIAVQNTVDNPQPVYWQTVNFTVTAANLGPGSASGVRVLARMPEGLLYQANTASQGSYNPVSGVWNAGAIAAGQSASLKITAQVRAAGVSLTSEASLANLDQNDPNPVNNAQAVKLVIPPAFDLALSASADNIYPRIGQNVILNLVARNQGPGTSPDLNVINVQLPAGLKNVSTTPSSGTFDPATGQWSVGSLAKGGEARLQITALVSQGGARTVTFSQLSQNPDFDRSNDSVNFTIYAQNSVSLDGVSAQLRVTPDREFSLASGGLLTYRLLVKNLATEERTNLTVRLPIDPNLVLADVTFDNPQAWVTKVVTNQPNAYVEMRLPDLEVQRMVSATARFRAGPGAQPGTVILSRFTVQVSEENGEGYTTLSNAVRFTLTANSSRDDSAGGVQFYSPLGGATGTTAHLKLVGDFYTPGEKVNLWYTDEKGVSVTLGDIYANNEGQIVTDINLKALAAGQNYVIAGYGNQSEIIGCAVVTITGQNSPEVKSYTVRPLTQQEVDKLQR